MQETTLYCIAEMEAGLGMSARDFHKGPSGFGTYKINYSIFDLSKMGV
jgi:hypothetical protein